MPLQICVLIGGSLLQSGATPRNADFNYITVSDWAARSSAQSSSAAWALFAVSAHQMHLVAAGAVMFSSFASSMDAELAALELAAGALLKLSRGYGDVVPHDTDLILSEPEFLEAYHHLWSIR